MKLPRHIKPEIAHIGDTIRVTWKTDDVERSIVGVIAERDYQGSSRVLSTKEGHELLRYIPGNSTKTVVTLLAYGPVHDTPALFEMETIN